METRSKGHTSFAFAQEAAKALPSAVGKEKPRCAIASVPSLVGYLLEPATRRKFGMNQLIASIRCAWMSSDDFFLTTYIYAVLGMLDSVSGAVPCAPDHADL